MTATDDLIYEDDVASDEDADADDSIDKWAVCMDEPAEDDDGSHEADMIDPASSFVPPTTASVAGYRKAWGYGPKTLQRMRREKDIDKTTAANLGLKPIFTYFSPVSGAPAPIHSKARSPMTGGYKTVALTVAYEAISSRLKMLPNSAKATSEFQDTTLYTVQRLTAISVYFNELLDGQGRMQASTTAAKVLGRSMYILSRRLDTKIIPLSRGIWGSCCTVVG